MLHVALDRLDEVWDEVVAAGELHVDLRKRVLDAIAGIDEVVVNADRVQHRCHDNREEDQK